MELKDVVEKRFSIRKYLDKDVPDEVIEKIIDLARFAPSAGSLQSYKVLVSREKLTGWGAPVYLIIYADLTPNKYGKRGEFYATCDAVIFASYIQLIAVDMGLSTCWVGAFVEKKFKRDGAFPVCIISLGYSDIIKERGKRKGLKEIIWI